MNSTKKILIGVLFMVSCAPAEVFSSENAGDTSPVQQLQKDKERTRARLDLREILRDRGRWQILFRDRSRMHAMLEQGDLRWEMLKCPRFMRQMMQNVDMRRELQQNELMMQAMLQNREIHREIDRNPKMIAELENNKTYRQFNQDQQTDILEELLTELTVSGVFSQSR